LIVVKSDHVILNLYLDIELCTMVSELLVYCWMLYSRVMSHWLTHQNSPMCY